MPYKYSDFLDLCIPANHELKIQLKEIKAQYHLDWNRLFFHLCTTNERPDDYQSHYKRKVVKKNKKDLIIYLRISPKAIMVFNIFCAAFKNKGDGLDYLVWNEKIKPKFPSLS